MSEMRRNGWFAMVVATAMVAALGIPAARAATPTWRREPGGQLEAVAAGHGAVYVTGHLSGGAKRGSLVVARYATDGRLEWRRTWRVVKHDWHASGESLALAPGGGVYVGGSSGYGEGGDALLLRYSATGRLLWERTVATAEGHAHIAGLAATDGGVIATIADEGCCAIFDHDGYVQAFDADGSRGWRRDFEAPGIPARTWDSVAGLAIGGGGRIFVAGEIDRGVWTDYPAPLPDEDLTIQALGSDGRVLWTRVLGDGRGGRDWDQATDIDVRGRLLVVTGMMWRTRRQEPQAWVGAFDIDGHRRWTRRWGEGELFRSATSVSIAPWGAVYVGTARWPNTGPSLSWLRRYERHGTLERERALGSDPGGFVTGVATSGSVYVSFGRQLQRWAR